MYIDILAAPRRPFGPYSLAVFDGLINGWRELLKKTICTSISLRRRTNIRASIVQIEKWATVMIFVRQF